MIAALQGGIDLRRVCGIARRASGADTRKHKPSNPEEIKLELDLYMKPYLKVCSDRTDDQPRG